MSDNLMDELNDPKWEIADSRMMVRHHLFNLHTLNAMTTDQYNRMVAILTETEGV
jgi:hypothetical protein